MNRISRNISIALRAERIISRRRFALLRTQVGTLAMAGLIAVLGVIMLNVAAYQGLSTVVEPYLAALIVAGANLLIAVLLAVYANRMNIDAELEPAIEVRDMAIEEVEADVEAAIKEAAEVAEDIKDFARDPFGKAGANLIGPALKILINTVSKK